MELTAAPPAPDLRHAQLQAFLTQYAEPLRELGCWPVSECRPEIMSPAFCKWHLGQIRPGFWPVLHHFTAPDAGAPHDHPRGFLSHVLAGGYAERIYHRQGADWATTDVFRAPGTAHYVAAAHIHRVLALPAGACWTLVLAGPVEQAWRHYDVGNAL